jgi:hypothetical protein
MVAVVALPEAKVTACPAPASRLTSVRSNAARFGLPEREYSKPYSPEHEHVTIVRYAGRNWQTLCTPTASCLYVVLSDMGGITAPVTGSGSEPMCMARVEKPKSGSDEGFEWFLSPFAWPLGWPLAVMVILHYVGYRRCGKSNSIFKSINEILYIRWYVIYVIEKVAPSSSYGEAMASPLTKPNCNVTLVQHLSDIEQTFDVDAP